MGTALNQELSLKKTLENYDHIQLTEDEITMAMIDAKRKKENILQLERLKEIEEENRKRKREKFDFLGAKTWFAVRANNLITGASKEPKHYIFDRYSEPLFDMLCYYFNGDADFVKLAEAYGVKNPSLEKGLLLAGNFGVGKSMLLKIFMQNKRQSYFIREAKKIADQFVQSKEKTIPEEYFAPFENGFDDPNVFYQKYSGLCIDDIGAERVKNNFGNISNVVGDLIEHRYSFVPVNPDMPKLIGPMLHGATNLSSDDLKEYYGERVLSRMREVFNFIVCKGNDRRK